MNFFFRQPERYAVLLGTLLCLWGSWNLFSDTKQERCLTAAILSAMPLSSRGKFDSYHGVWSGPSVAALKMLCSAMTTARDQFPILLVNADSLDTNNSADTAKAKELFGSLIGAWGETCWIKNGAIIAQDILGHIKPMHEFSKDFSSTLKRGKRLQRDEQLPRTLDELKGHIDERIELVNS